MKRYIAAIIAAILVISCLPVMALAADVGAGSTVTVTLAIDSALLAGDIQAFTSDSGNVAFESMVCHVPFHAVNGTNASFASTEENLTGSLATATFKVSNDVAPGTYTISISGTGYLLGYIEVPLSVSKTIVIEGEKHTHTGETWESDENNHWHRCEGCGEKFGEAKHTKSETPEEDGWYVCTVCGYKMEEHKEEHTHSWSWKYDATKHWQECSCDEKQNEGKHTKSETPEEDGWYVCTVCGYKMEKHTEDHTHFWSWKYDATKHWQECSCNDTQNEGKHTFVYDKTTKKEVCSICGYTRDHKAHVCASDAWEKDKTYHWHICDLCGEKFEKDKHVKPNQAANDGHYYCEDCGYDMGKANSKPSAGLDDVPKTGDITNQIILTTGAVVLGMVAAVAFVFKRKRAH